MIPLINHDSRFRSRCEVVIIWPDYMNVTEMLPTNPTCFLVLEVPRASVEWATNLWQVEWEYDNKPWIAGGNMMYDDILGSIGTMDFVLALHFKTKPNSLFASQN